jgi:inosine-uridine nucleoside N-ribohydrolase
MAIPVILDTDIGSDIDDTWALALLLRCPELDLKLVLTETLDTVYRARVTAKLLEVAGRTDVQIGIGIPGETGVNEFQAPWVADYELTQYPGVVHQDGVQAMIDLIRTADEPVTIIGIGPAPNLLHALTIAPDIAVKCRFVGMFGSVDRGYGDGSAPIAETNVREHVAAARAIFAAPWQEIIITPLDTCDQANLRDEHYRLVLASDDPLVQAVVENYRIWADLVTWMTVDFFHERSSTLFDTVAVYLAYSQAFVNIEPLRLRVTDDGRTVRDGSGDLLSVALSWRDLNAFHDHLVKRLLGSD